MKRYESLADLAGHLARRGAAPALRVHRDDGVRSFSYAELADDIARLAKGLAASGLARGEPVVLWAPNSAAWIASHLGIVCAGGLVVPLDDLCSDREMARVMADSGARRIFTGRDHLPALRTLPNAARLDIVLLDADGDSVPDAAAWRDLQSNADIDLPVLTAADTACLLYTSGTTGTPKAVPLSHRNILASVEALVAGKLAGPRDRVLLPLPLHHAYPFTVGLLGTLASGGTVVLPAGLSGPQIAGALKASRATILIGVPRLYTALLSAIDARVARRGALLRSLFAALLAVSGQLRRQLGLRIGRLVFVPLHRAFARDLRVLGCGGARLDAEAAWKLEALGWEVLTGYGLTETSPMLTFSTRGRGRADTAGRPLPGIELRIDAEDGQSFGEICARGDSVFAGYRNNPEATRRAFTADGWLRTGDLGFLDAEGYLHIVGRATEVIVLPGGKNVVPEDVEAAYTASPLIRDAAILERDGALAGLFVPDGDALRARGTASAGNLLREAIEDISLTLPPYRRVSGYRITQETLPRTHLGKLRRHLLPAIYDRAEHAALPTAVELSDADRRLLASEPAGRVWHWLAARFPGNTLTLDTSPQLDLQIDSLGWVSLSLEIEEHTGTSLTGEAIARIVTLRDLLQAVNAAAAAPRETAAAELAEDTRWLRPLGPLLSLLGILVYALNRLVIRSLFDLRVEGIDRLPARGPYVVTPNHFSYLDPLVIAAALPRHYLKQVYWAGWTGQLFTSPASRLLSRIARVFPVDPDRAPARSLALGAAVLERGHILVWFPEGRRSRDGRLGRFLPGIGELLQQSGVAAVPASIAGTFEALPAGRRVPRRGRITVVFGAPSNVADLAAAGEAPDRAARIADGLRRAVARLSEAAQK